MDDVDIIKKNKKKTKERIERDRLVQWIEEECFFEELWQPCLA